MSKNRVSRRQFLSYTIMGVGGFMASGTIMPMLRFAVDPVLQKSGEGDFTATPQRVDELTETPVRVDYTIVDRQDGWYKSDESYSAWVYKSGDRIVALSPVCKHLGCTVNWGGDKNHPDQFFCPCHAGRYEKNGKHVPGTPPIGPLDEYLWMEKDGYLYLGGTTPNTLV
ncbi:ubiquinol-cytochrome c reductase iron-sulfur subunit [Sporosarcina ureilytica]|uniref:Menaquinol:cytochrome c reductase iron-sulfur subunit n=1 Tax=Sporosarcina ureilytica TaxID=298596 RepID=A0A1D8JH72_9BACL|nr:ubiquinol-cytochrome c reductase iron-sulfur subunit [Sporosarcina ureilytica]AOV08056.1 menaquinol-cytochrome C reductase [Sporosarcina ureilytica]